MRVEIAGRSQVGAERLFDHDTAETRAVVAFLQQACLAEVLDNRLEEP